MFAEFVAAEDEGFAGADDLVGPVAFEINQVHDALARGALDEDGHTVVRCGVHEATLHHISRYSKIGGKHGDNTIARYMVYSPYALQRSIF